MTRSARVERTTKETSVRVEVDLDGSGQTSISTGVGFFDHLLTSFGHHALLDLTVETEGDLEIDDHHTVEDTAIVLGGALAEAMGHRAGIQRFGDATVPMDEALATVSLDVGGRPYAVIDVPLRQPMIGNFSTQNLSHALEAMARHAGITLHVRATGLNDHHVAEATVKALARAFRAAITADPSRSGIPSTKGTT